jgi:hypothetical protein
MTLAADYRRDGFVVCPGLVDAATVQALCEEALAIASGQRGAIAGLPAGAAGTADASSLLQQVLAIHFPHKLSALMRAMLGHPPIVEVLVQLIGPDIKCMQSMLFVKNAGKPGQAWHQDETFIPTTDATLTGVWIALDEATVDNGCLWVQPGSHRARHLWPSRPCKDPRFDGAPESHGWPYPAEGGMPVEVAAGSVVFFNGYTLHRSLGNRRASGARRALVLHCMSAAGELPWPFGSSAFAPHDYRDIVMVSGKDTYAQRGLEDLAMPYLRPENPTAHPT